MARRALLYFIATIISATLCACGPMPEQSPASPASEEPAINDYPVPDENEYVQLYSGRIYYSAGGILSSMLEDGSDYKMVCSGAKELKTINGQLYCYISGSQVPRKITPDGRTAALPVSGADRTVEISGGYIYYVEAQENSLYSLKRIDMQGSSPIAIKTDSLSYEAKLSGGYLFYTCEVAKKQKNGLYESAYIQLMRSQPDGSEETMIDEGEIVNLQTAGGALVYQKGVSWEKAVVFWSYDIQSGERDMLFSTKSREIESITAEFTGMKDGWAYFVLNGGNKPVLYRKQPGSFEGEVVWDTAKANSPRLIHVDLENGWLYYAAVNYARPSNLPVYYEGGDVAELRYLYRSRIDGTEKMEIYNYTARSVAGIGEWIYFTGPDSSLEAIYLMRFNLRTKSMELLENGRVKGTGNLIVPQGGGLK
ncbi:MAG: DUF5050 domain-containing protein [Bacillota bacterium]|nr:DUF5050 domain-containing protein [Bacillota bacterium]